MSYQKTMYRLHRFDCNDALSRLSLLVLREAVLARRLTRLERSFETESGVHTLDAVRGVDVLDESDLVACGASLTGDDGAVGEEIFPDLTHTHNDQY